MPEPRVGEHLVDGRVVAAGHDGGRRRQLAEDAYGVPGGRLEGLARLVVAAPGEPLLALPARLGASLHVPLADLGLDDPLARQPGHREAALADQQHAPVRRARSPRPTNAAASGSPWYSSPNGSRAVNVDPSDAAPCSAPSVTASPVVPCRPLKLSTHRSMRAAGTRTEVTARPVGDVRVGRPRCTRDPIAVETAVRSRPCIDGSSPLVRPVVKTAR